MRFEDICALVTGGARGQGAAEVRALAAEGAHVVIADVLDEEGAALSAEIGQGCAFVRADVTSEADWRRVVAEAEMAFGPVGVLINNAGVIHTKAVLDTTPAEFEAVMRVNMMGAFLGARETASSMRRRGGGAIVNVVSISALRATPSACAYVASKWALRGFTRAAAHDLAQFGIRVNAVHPGPVDTPMISNAGIDIQAFADRNVDRLPLGRVGRPEDVAEAVLFLASPQSAFITGAELIVDGGWTLR